ncbi:MAG: PorV/PorQ family protein, partial [Elusimicrobia bacterium]|nr:PorV/PorQ family protein [Elusimicrobiota bacterium]
MKKTFRLIVVAQFIGLICLINQATTYASGPGTTAASFLKIAVGAKNIAMGETGATSDDANAVYWNPAGLNEVYLKQVSLMHAIWFQDISYEHLGYAHPTKIGTFGLGLNYLSMKAIEGYDENDNPLNETYKPSDMAVTISYARKVKDIPAGVNIKYISSKLEDESATAFAADIGGIYDKLKIKNEKLKIGLAVQNIGTKMKFIDEGGPLPLNIKLGCSYNILRRKNPAIILALDINKTIDSDIRANFGSEYSRKFGKNIICSGMVGYKTNTEGYEAINGLSAGFGFSFKEYSLDYAFVSFGELGDTHRISLLAKFGGTGEMKTVPVKKMENYVTGEITGEDNKPVQGATIKIIQNNKGIAEVYTDDNGKYQTELLPASKYTVNVRKDGYITDEAEVEVKEAQPVKADFQLKKVAEKPAEPSKIIIVKEENRGLVVNLASSVLFDSGKSKLKPASYSVMNEVVKLMQDYPENKILIEG